MHSNPAQMTRVWKKVLKKVGRVIYINQTLDDTRIDIVNEEYRKIKAGHYD